MTHRSYETISFLSDYGWQDEFVGVVKSVLRQEVPDVTVIDLTHGIAPFDIKGGSMALVRAAEYLCPGVVLAVVDPGVGGSRKAIAVEVGGGESVLVGPDNGLLAPVVALVGGADRAVVLTRPEAKASTFDGRDLFAPAAAALCRGVDLAELGELIDPAELVPAVLAFSKETSIGFEADVLWVDRFGNVQLNLSGDSLADWPEKVMLNLAERTISARRVNTFSDIEEHHAGLIIDASGMVSLVLNQESASGHFGLHAGDSVTVRKALA